MNAQARYALSMWLPRPLSRSWMTQWSDAQWRDWNSVSIERMTLRLGALATSFGALAAAAQTQTTSTIDFS